MNFKINPVLRLAYRLLSPIINPLELINGFKTFFKYPGFFIQYINYRRRTSETVPFVELYPCLKDNTSASQSGRGHYFYQDIWAIGRIVESVPKKHVDVGSRIDGFAGQLSTICEVEYIDLRPVNVQLAQFKMVEGSVTHLPYLDKSIPSISALHVIEHVGLGRYGDHINYQGSRLAARELARVLAVDGRLLVGVPIGKERVAFNAHRIFSPNTILEYFQELQLIEFSVITDNGKFVRFANPSDYVSSDYACGLYHFTRIT
jgi:hypothetical protein